MNNANNNINIQVRQSRREDVVDLIQMIEDLAAFEKIFNEPELSVEDVIQACGFDNDPGVESLPDIIALVAEDVTDSPHHLIGYTILLPAYSARSGRILQMKNMFVRESHRGSGVGRALFRALAAYARDNGYRHEENHVLNWNRPAVNFYKRMGALDMTEIEHWHYYRMYLT